MRKRILGDTDLELSIIGLGAWAMGGGDWAYAWGPQDDVESISAIHKALDIGVNWIDTAPVYGLGHSEEIVGKAIKGKRDAIIIATKCGLLWNDRGDIEGRLTAKSVRQEVEDSLKRLQTDYIDLYQIHWPHKAKTDLEAWEEIDAIIKEGKIRYAGVSNFSKAQLESLKTIRRPSSLQPPFSMIERRVENELLPYCQQEGIGVVAYSPMQCGLLTGKMTKERVLNLPEDDFRKRDKHFKEPLLSATLYLALGLEKIAAQSNRTAAQLSLAWILKREEVTSAIVGTRKPHQIEETSQAGDWDLSEEEYQSVQELLDEWKAKIS